MGVAHLSPPTSHHLPPPPTSQYNVFEPGDHASTYGGNPLACAAGLAVANEFDNHGLLQVRSVLRVFVLLVSLTSIPVIPPSFLTSNHGLLEVPRVEMFD